MKKILHISKYYYPYFGGIEDVAHTIVTEMRDDYEQRVICFNHEYTGTFRTDDEGVQVVRVKTPLVLASQPIPLLYFSKLTMEIMSFKPDIIHVHLPNPLVASMLKFINLGGAKVVLHWHSDILDKGLLYKLYRPMEKWLLDRADVIITTSPQYFEKSEPLQPYASKIHILPNVVNEEKLQPMPSDEKEAQRIRDRFKDKKIVLFLGRHVPYKGIELLIEAARNLPDDCVVLIGGTGELTEKLQEQAMSFGNKVQFIGQVQNKEMRAYFSVASVFAFPSIDRREAFGVALAEALYCGLPAVSFNIEGSGSIWVNQHEKTGLVVKQIAPAPFADAITRLLENEELRLQYSENAKKWVRENFLKDQIRSLTKIYG